MIHECTTEEIAVLRLQSQFLVGSSLTKPDEVVRNMLAMQAQDFAGAQMAIGARAPGVTAKHVRTALDKGEVVRSWPMRGTLHFVPPEDLGWMLELTRDRMLKSVATRQREHGLDEKTLRQAEKTAVDVLSGNGRASREEMMKAFEDAGIGTAGQRGYHLIWYLSQIGITCWGPTHKTQQSLVLLDEWVKKPRLLRREEALGEFVFRYFAGHGPATLKDFIWWTKLTTTEAKLGFAAVQDRLVELRYEGISHWMTKDVFARCDPGSKSAKKSLLLLPSFDEHLLGYQNRDVVLQAEYAKTIVPGGNGIFLSTIVDGGKVVGTWKRFVTKTKAVIDPVYFIDPVYPNDWPAQSSKRLKSAVEVYGKFIGLPAELK